MELINLKSIPIYRENVKFSLNKEELSLLKKLEFYKNNGFYITLSSEILNDVKFNRIKNFFNQKAEFYKNKILEIKNEIYLTQSWSTINKKGSFHHMHKHPNTFISVVYYISCDGGSLFFDLNKSQLEEGFNFEYNIKNYNSYNSTGYNLNVNSGDIVIFPGWLSHKSIINNSDTDKFLIGCNYFIKGQLGSEKTYSKITI